MFTINYNTMKTMKFLTTLALVSVGLIAGCEKDDFVEIPGVCPVVISTIPADDAVNVPLDQVVSATFNERMNPASITEASFTLMQGDESIDGEVTYADSTAFFTPSSPLTPNTLYLSLIHI